VIITYDRVLDGSDDTSFDCGAVATALVNAAWSRGLGAVINRPQTIQKSKAWRGAFLRIAFFSSVRLLSLF
jgi:hypothetical protein